MFRQYVSEYRTQRIHFTSGFHCSCACILFLSSRCDGRLTATPTSTPAVGVSGTDTTTDIASGDVCTLCDGKRLDSAKSISFQSQTTTCGSLDSMLITTVQAEENPVVQSSTCSSAREMYQNDCCIEECQLCKTPSGNLLDLKGEVVVQQGGYDASCRDVSDLLSKSYSAKESMCTDAHMRLANKCCYQQCTLCGDQSENTTFWFNTVFYQGLTTTCLGLDYLLRAEQLMDGSDSCGDFQTQYANQCCYQTANSCQLCDAASQEEYELDSDKIVIVQQSSTTKPCSAVNFSLAKYQKLDAMCMEERQAYFRECCVAKKGVVTEFDPTSIVGSEQTDSSPVVANPAASPSSSTNGESGGVPSPSPIGEAVNPAVEKTSDALGGQPSTSAPSQSHSWNSPAEFDWEQIWDPPKSNSGLRSTRLEPLALLLAQILHVFA